ncbi:hypothetical protein PROFUN_10786 [Planoprotostelium fungivorum]|uniref:Uncharacterized protein n=1 Tax=Planoprotostelium fungivorum TaxID=1890364 RepID=A0A2P6NCW5_9EUKA|nr:hypothetical protein PROFUN_10786 [Planoprotostelium fungivorum]
MSSCLFHRTRNFIEFVILRCFFENEPSPLSLISPSRQCPSFNQALDNRTTTTGPAAFGVDELPSAHIQTSQENIEVHGVRINYSLRNFMPEIFR